VADGFRRAAVCSCPLGRSFLFLREKKLEKTALLFSFSTLLCPNHLFDTKVFYQARDRYAKPQYQILFSCRMLGSVSLRTADDSTSKDALDKELTLIGLMHCVWCDSKVEEPTFSSCSKPIRLLSNFYHCASLLQNDRARARA
jgi:hypothetical protein